MTNARSAVLISVVMLGCGSGDDGTGGAGGGAGGGGGSTPPDPCEGISGAHTLTWEDGGTMPASSKAAAVSLGDLIYVYTQGKLHAFDPAAAADPWRELPAPAQAREGAIASDGAQIFLVGGDVFATPQAAVEVYDPVAESWSALPDLPEARTSNNALVLGDYLYSLGGETTTRGPTTTDVWAYDRTDGLTGSWTNAPVLSRARGLGAVAVNGQLAFLIGGAEAIDFFAGTTGQNTFYIYDSATAEWIDGAAMPTARALMSNAASVCGALYVVGGRDGTADLASVDVYDLERESWFPSTAMTLARSTHGVVGHAGKVYVFGGFSSTNDSYTNAVEIGTPNEAIE